MVYRHTDGMYYFTASLPEYNGIALRRASTLAGLADAEETMIWKKHDKGIMSVHIKARLSCITWTGNGTFILLAVILTIYGRFVRMCWSADADPITGTWVEKGKNAEK